MRSFYIVSVATIVLSMPMLSKSTNGKQDPQQDQPKLESQNEDICVNQECVNLNTQYEKEIYDIEMTSSIPGSEYDKLEQTEGLRISMPVAPADGQETTLRQVLILHRHGDRTVIDMPSKDNLKDEPFWKLHGYGQLTNKGKTRLYLLGQMMRRRYDKFLNHSVNKNERFSRASGSLRCIESAQVFLASFLALNVEMSNDAKELVWDSSSNELSRLWQPASIQTVSSSIDGMLAESAVCKNLDREYKKIDRSSGALKLLVNYKEQAEALHSSYDFVIEEFYYWFWASSLLEVERTYFPNKMKKEILAIYDKVQEAGNKAIALYQSTHTSKRLRGGLLINDIVTKMEKRRRGAADVKKIYHYAAHDLTIVILLAMIDEFISDGSFKPDYASTLLFELHEDSDHQWYVKVFFMREVPSIPTELKLDSCEKDEKGRCSIEKFAGLIEKYRITSWTDWMKECDNSLENADPYA